MWQETRDRWQIEIRRVYRAALGVKVYWGLVFGRLGNKYRFTLAYEVDKPTLELALNDCRRYIDEQMGLGR